MDPDSGGTGNSMKVELPYSWHESSIDSKLTKIMEKLIEIDQNHALHIRLDSNSRLKQLREDLEELKHRNIWK